MVGYGDPAAGMGFAMLFFYVAFMWIAVGVPLWRILTRAGFSGLWILLFLVLPPVGILVIALMLAFARWPALAGRGEAG